jgi:predicted XRE-type DNA-binding protein
MKKTTTKKAIGGMEFVTMPDNMYAHFGLPNADVLKARADLKIRLRQVIMDRKLTQTQVAKLLGVSQPHVSHIMAGKLKKASMESLMGYLNKMGVEIDILARSKSSKAPARTQVAA